MNRRDFCKVAAAGTLTLTGASAGASPTEAQSAEALGVLVDTTVCIGCRKCEFACNQANLPFKRDKSFFEDKSVFADRRRPDDHAYTVVNAYPNPSATDRPYYMKIQCLHCNHPACVSACIVGALRKDARGPVHYDSWKCIGCRYCMVACPFQIPAYEYRNALDPMVRKCDFCFERVTREGKKPACVEICPNEALTFGPRSELLELAYSHMAKYPDKYVHHVYGEHEVGGTSWMYLAGIDFARTELPALDAQPIPERTERIQHSIFKSFVPPVALYGFLALAMFALRKDRTDDEQH